MASANSGMIDHTNHIPHVIKWCEFYSKQLHLYKTDTVLATKVLPSKNSKRVKAQYIYMCVYDVCVYISTQENL